MEQRAATADPDPVLLVTALVLVGLVREQLRPRPVVPVERVQLARPMARPVPVYTEPAGPLRVWV